MADKWHTPYGRGPAPAGSRPEKGYRAPNRTLAHLRSEPPDPLTFPSYDELEVGSLGYDPHPDRRARKYLNEPPDEFSRNPAGMRSFDAEGPMPERTALNPSLPEAKIVRVEATGKPAGNQEWLTHRYPQQVWATEPVVRRRPTLTRRRRTNPR